MRGPRARPWQFVLGLAVLGLPLLWLNRFPTQDGPAHLENATLLAARARGEGGASLYHLNPRFDPTWLPHAALAALTTVLSPARADRLFAAGSLLAYLAACGYALRGLRRGAESRRLWLLPFASSYLLHMGFYGFCYALAALLWAIGWAARHRREPTRRAALVQAGLLVVVAELHPVAAVAAALAVAALWLAPLRSTPAGSRAWRLTAVAGATLPAAALVAWFAAGQPAAPWRWLPVTVALRALATLDVLAAYRPAELVVSTTLSLALATGVAVVSRRRRHGEWSLLAVAAICGILAVAAPNRLAGGSWVSHRLSLVAWLSATLWLAAQRMPRAAARALGALCCSAALALLVIRWPTLLRLDEQLAEYASLGDRLEPGRTLLPLAFAPRGLDAAGAPLSRKVQPFLHAGGWLAAEQGVLDLANYEASLGYFPLRYRREVDPYLWLAPPGGLEAVPPRVDLARYYAQTGVRIDYVLLWGAPADSDLAPEPATAGLAAALSSGYDLVAASSPRGLARLYRRRSDSIR